MASFGNLPNASRSIIHGVSIESFLGRFATGIAYRITISPALHNPVFDMAAHQFRQIVKARFCGGLIREDEAVRSGGTAFVRWRALWFQWGASKETSHHTAETVMPPSFAVQSPISKETMG